MTLKDLRPYQRRIAHFLTAHPHACLSVGMGLGKTAAVLAFLDYTLRLYPHARILIVAPKRVAETVWLQEAEKWELWNLRSCMCLVAGTKKRKEEIAASSYRMQVKVVSRDNISLFADQHFDILVIDELTSFKSWKAARSKAVRSIEADRKIGLTGTFAPNGLMDIYPQMACLDMAGKKDGDYYAWVGRWFENVMAGSGQPFKRFVLRRGVQPREVVAPWLKDIITLTTEDYLQLPPMVEVTLPVELSREERKAYDDLNAVLHFELPDSLEDFTVEARSKFAKLQTLASGFVYDTETGDAVRIKGGGTKIRHAVEFCLECAEMGESVLLFYNYRETAVWFGEMAKEACLRIASTSSNGWLQKWNGGELDVLVANPASAGHGLNLQHGGHVVLWLELTYNYELFAQANARLHRTGQEKRVRCYYMLSGCTLDGRVLSALRSKGRVNGEVEQVTKGVGK